MIVRGGASSSHLDYSQLLNFIVRFLLIFCFLLFKLYLPFDSSANSLMAAQFVYVTSPIYSPVVLWE